MLEDYLPTGNCQRRAVLLELVHTDLEYRLKDGEPARVEEYLAHFPELKGDPAAELELIDGGAGPAAAARAGPDERRVPGSLPAVWHGASVHLEGDASPRPDARVPMELPPMP